MNSILLNWKTSLVGAILIVVGVLGSILDIHIPGFDMDSGAAITMGLGLILAKDGTAPTVAKVLVAAWLLASLSGGMPPAAAANLLPATAAKAPSGSLLSDGYPSAKCGLYYGVNTMGSSNGVNGAGVGAQVVQGDIGLSFGYACPFGAASFWFVEGLFDVANLNGTTNGIALGGPATFEQRVGIGSPLNALLGSIIPALGTSATSQLPALPGLPSGVSAGPGQPYFFAGLSERDISATVGLSQNREWLIQPGIGVGLLTPLSNKVTIDTFVEFDFASNSICVGPAPSCAHLGDGVKVGLQAKY